MDYLSLGYEESTRKYKLQNIIADFKIRAKDV